jgi:hypothetical protein
MGVRDAVHHALRQAGIPDTDMARTERLLSTAVLGFAVSEAAGRFHNHDQAVIDAGFAELQQWLRRLLPGTARRGRGPARCPDRCPACGSADHDALRPGS